MSCLRICTSAFIAKFYQENIKENCYILFDSLTMYMISWHSIVDSDRAALSLLSQIKQKKQEQWEEAVNSINFLQSSCKAWSTINNLTGRSGCCSRLCCMSAYSIASQLMKIRAHKTGSCKSTKLVNKELSDLWEVWTPEGNSISGSFRPKQLAATFRYLKPRKSPGLDSMLPEFILHARSALNSWFCHFLTSCLHQLKIPKIWRRALTVMIPKLDKFRDPKELLPYISSVCLLQDPHLHSCQTSHRPIASTGAGRLLTQEVDQVTLL